MVNGEESAPSVVGLSLPMCSMGVRWSTDMAVVSESPASIDGSEACGCSCSSEEADLWRNIDGCRPLGSSVLSFATTDSECAVDE